MEYRTQFPVSTMCSVLKVSRNGYYYWCKHGSRQKDPHLLKLVEEIFEESFKTYGTRRIKAALQKQYGWIVSRRRIGKAMKALGLKAKTKQRFRVQTTDSKHDLPISPNLVEQDFYASTPGEVYVGDITYIKTKEGWLYLAIVIDLYARMVVGYAIADHMRSALICQALKVAYHRRGRFQKGAIFHSDRGSQYASQEYRELLETFQMRQSMSGKGNCYDNAACESFFGSMKTELILPTRFQTKKEAEQSIIHYIGFYNTKRLHSYNGYCTPVETELMWWQSQFGESA
ncbi:MAG: IS3 family transposase [Sulfurovum sp.]|nr:IS3 family transposase [Sulfurovum sp.]